MWREHGKSKFSSKILLNLFSFDIVAIEDQFGLEPFFNCFFNNLLINVYLILPGSLQVAGESLSFL